MRCSQDMRRRLVGYSRDIPRILPGYSQDIPRIPPVYSQDTPGILSGYAQNTPRIPPGYPRILPGYSQDTFHQRGTFSTMDLQIAEFTGLRIEKQSEAYQDFLKKYDDTWTRTTTNEILYMPEEFAMQEDQQDLEKLKLLFRKDNGNSLEVAKAAGMCEHWAHGSAGNMEQHAALDLASEDDRVVYKIGLQHMLPVGKLCAGDSVAHKVARAQGTHKVAHKVLPKRHAQAGLVQDTARARGTTQLLPARTAREVAQVPALAS